MLEKYKKYLPSKKLAFILIIVIILLMLIYLIFFSASGIEIFGNKKNTEKHNNLQNKSITEIIQNDTDGDGIFDWEEDLWGTDKNKKITFGSISDSTYIENKKKELKSNDDQNISNNNLTETEKFSREFFASYSAMKSSGEFDKESIDQFSSALGKKISNPDLIDIYKESDVKISDKEDKNYKEAYYNNLKKTFEYYKTSGIGDELQILSQKIISSSDSEDKETTSKKLLTIANSYQDFAKKIMNLNVPKSLIKYHIEIANNSNNTGISIKNMEKANIDPILGLSGISQYKKYSESLIESVANLEVELMK